MFRMKDNHVGNILIHMFLKQSCIPGGITKRELRIFVHSLAMLGVASIQQEEELDLYMQGTDSVVVEKKLYLIVH